MSILVNWLISTLVLIAVAYLLPGIHIDNFLAALAAAIVLGVVNAILKPLLLILTLPINIVTLGLFTLVINAVLLMFTSLIVPGFRIDNFWWAIVLGLALSVVNSLLHHFSSK